MATNILYEGDLDENDNWRKPIMLGYKILHGAIQRKWYFRNEKLVIIGYRIMHGCDLNGNEHFKNRNYSFDLLGSRINVICWGSRTSFPIFSDWVRVVCSSFLHVQSLQTRVRILISSSEVSPKRYTCMSVTHALLCFSCSSARIAWL